MFEGNEMGVEKEGSSGGLENSQFNKNVVRFKFLANTLY